MDAQQAFDLALSAPRSVHLVFVLARVGDVGAPFACEPVWTQEQYCHAPAASTAKPQALAAEVTGRVQDRNPLPSLAYRSSRTSRAATCRRRNRRRRWLSRRPSWHRSATKHRLCGPGGCRHGATAARRCCGTPLPSHASRGGRRRIVIRRCSWSKLPLRLQNHQPTEACVNDGWVPVFGPHLSGEAPSGTVAKGDTIVAQGVIALTPKPWRRNRRRRTTAT